MPNKAEIDKERPLFEAWAIGHDGPWTPKAIKRRDGEGYGNEELQIDWDCWQACAATTREELATWKRRALEAEFGRGSGATTPPAPAPSTLAEQSETRTTLWKMPEEDGTLRQWYFDCDGHYIDVALDDGKYSIFFRDRATNQDAWLDLADEVVAAVPRKAAVAGEPVVGYLLYDNHGNGDIDTYFRKEMPDEPRFPALQWYVPLTAGEPNKRRLDYLADGVPASKLNRADGEA